METLKKTKSASIKMLNRYGYKLKDVDALIDLLNTQPQTFFSEVLPKSGHTLKSGSKDKTLFLKAIKNYCFKIDHCSETIGEARRATASGSIFEQLAPGYGIMLSDQKIRMKKLRDIIGLVKDD